MRAVLITLVAAFAAGPALAQRIGEPLPGRQDQLGARRVTPAPAQAARPCPEYGPGFVRMEGSSACVRVGGRVRVDVGKSSQSGYGTRTTGQAVLETRGESWAGPFTGVIVGGGGMGRGLDPQPYR